MSRKDNLIKSKSIYTIRRKHQTVSTGTIYENDHVTIIQNDGIFNEDMPMFSDSNFKFRIRTSVDGKKKHARYGWINNNFSEDQVWTLSSMPTNKISEETKIVQKPNYQSIRDFAYYGSAVELIKATVNDIIMRYPGGISYYYCDDAPEIWVDGERYYLVSNEFNIDFWTPKGVSADELENPMRVLGASYMNYEDAEGNDIDLRLCITGNCPDSIIGKVSFSNYYNDDAEREDDRLYGSKRLGDFILGERDGFEDNNDEDQGDSSILLTITAYTKSQNNTLRPIKFRTVTFRAFADKDCSEYINTATTTDENGVAKVRIENTAQAHNDWIWVTGNIYLQSTNFWTASINYNNQTYFIKEEEEETEQINCTTKPVKSMSDNFGVIECPQTDKQIFVSAYTVNDNNVKLPIRGQFVELHLYNASTCEEFSCQTLTNSNGVATQYIGDNYGWNLVSGDNETDIYGCNVWTSYMTYQNETESGHTGSETMSCNGIYGNSLDKEDFTDEILFDRTPTFKRLVVYTLCKENESPIGNLPVWIEASIQCGAIFGISGYTGDDGVFVALNNSEDWTLIRACEDYMSLNDIESWTASTSYNGNFIREDARIEETEITLYVNCIPDYQCECVTAYTFLNTENTSQPLSGAYATIVFFDGKSSQEFHGFTDEIGSFSACLSQVTALTGPAIGWYCYATSGDVTVHGERYLFGDNSNTLCFQNLGFYKEEEEEPVEYDLIITAYTKNQLGTMTLIKHRQVTFYACVEKSCTIYKKTKDTDEDGIAMVRLCEDCEWELVEGPDEGIEYVNYWYASMDFHGDTFYCEYANDYIQCISSNYVNNITQRQEDIIVCNYIAKKLIASAYTYMQSGQLYPITGHSVEFHAFVSKSCSEYVVSANVINGIASVYLSEEEGWEHVPGTQEEPLEYCDFWRCCMTYNDVGHSGTTPSGIISCNGLSGNDLNLEDYTDLIVYEFTSKFDFLKINVVCNDDDNTPISNVPVWIIATTDDLFSFRIDGYTDENGEFVANNDIDSGWYFNGIIWHVWVELNNVTTWTAYAYYDGVQHVSEQENMPISNNEYIFEFECKPNYMLDCLTVYALLGRPGNSTPIQNALGTIRLINDKDEYVDFTGYTGQDGGHTICLDEEHLNELNGKTAVKWWCCAEYNGHTESGRTIDITEGYYQNWQNLYFTGGTPPPETGIKLTVSAYTVYNGRKTPIQNEIVTFHLKSSDYVDVTCTNTARTNNNGIAHIYLSRPGWTCGNEYLAILMNPTCWFATMSYNGVVESGITTTTCICNGVEFERTNTIKKLTDEIDFDFSGGGEWDFCEESGHSITIFTVFDTGEPAANIPVSVSAATSYGGLFWIGGRTDSEGKLVLYESSNWRVINPGTYGNIHNATMFSACGFYNSNIVYGEPIDKIDGSDCQITITLKKKLVPPVPGEGEDICDMEGFEWFYIYMDGNGNKKLLTTCKKCGNISYNDLVIIRPKKQFREEFWYSLDDFERVILDRDGIPVYKSKFETPYTIDNVYYYNLKDYIWPTVDGETPDLTTTKFQAYIKSLIELAEYHDEFDSDNLWRMMTHESIKNLDWTFMRKNDAYENEDFSFDATRMRGILSTYGRFFDDLKRYADNIKNSNCITYDEKNNLPDYFLTDKVEIGGFEAKSVTSFSALTSGDVYNTSRNSTTSQLYTEDFGKTLSMINSDFMRRLAINENYIHSMKGTRRGLQAILGMFGYFENTDSRNQFTTVAGEYDIHEYIAVATEFPSYNDAAMLRGFTENINDFDDTEEMTGYPVAVVSPGIEDATENDYYLIPWYIDDANYKYPFYFQEKGGWGRMRTKTINEPITNASSITEEYGINIYKETEPYITFVNDIEALKTISNNKVFENMVCYVTDITGMYDEYVEDYTQEGRGIVNDNPNGILVNNQVDPDYSHYFVLKNVALSNYIGFVDNELYHCYGWKNVHLREFEGERPITEDGLRVLYLESVLEDGKDNNPHTGKGKYDDGNSYLEKYNFLFGDDFNNGMFEYLKESGEEEYLQYYESAQTIGFNLTGMVENNKKCYYFEDSQTTIESRAGSSSHSQDAQVGPNNWTEDTYTLIPIGEEDEYDYNDYESFVNPEGGSKTDEAAANSIVNVKNLVINFGTNGNMYMKKYIETVVMPYLEHMIPSTSILKYMFDGVSVNIEIGQTTHNYITSSSIVADIVTTDENSTYLFENNENIL